MSALYACLFTRRALPSQPCWGVVAYAPLLGSHVCEGHAGDKYRAAPIPAPDPNGVVQCHRCGTVFVPETPAAPIASDKRYTIAVDFDGVIHQYVSSWEAPWVITDPPMPGAFEWLAAMVAKFRVVINSSRFTPQYVQHGKVINPQARALAALAAWFDAHGLPAHVRDQLVVWSQPGKPAALVYIDDRAFRFEGAFPTAAEIHKLKPWKLPKNTDAAVSPHLDSDPPDKF